MGEVVRHNVVSVDGFVADEHDDVGPLFEWYFNGSVPLTDDGTCRVSQASSRRPGPRSAPHGGAASAVCR